MIGTAVGESAMKFTTRPGRFNSFAASVMTPE
jgi:hypothetical protein